MKYSITLLSVLFLFGCQQAAEPVAESNPDAAPAAEAAAEPMTLAEVLAAQPDDVQARYE